MIEVDFTTHPELYTDYKQAVAFCKAIPDGTKLTRHVPFHVQWIGSEIGRMQAMAIKAYLTSQDLQNTSLTIYTDRVSNNQWTEDIKHLVNFRVYDWRELIKGTPFESHQKERIHWQNTDIMRMVYLSKFGGVHLDMDTCLLRDISPFLEQEFFYTWGIKDEEVAGGLIHLFKDSPVNNAIVEALFTHGKELGYYRELFSYVRKTHFFYNLPCAFFNTEWAIRPEFYENDQHFQFIRSPVIKTDYSHELYDGVFSWHWHNCWQSPIEEGSKWQIVESLVNEKFKKMF